MTETKTEFDWEAYELRIAAHIQRVEAFLALPAGTLGDIRHDSDYLKILKMHATVEPLLNQLIETSLTRALQHPKANFPGGEAVAKLISGSRLEKKIRLAADAELISPDDAQFIRTLAAIRNYYAHSIKNMALSVGEIAAQISPSDEGRNVERALYGISKETQGGKHGPLVTTLMKPFMFHRFAHLVGTVVQGIDPPMLPFGILSGHFGKSELLDKLKSAEEPPA